LSTIKSDTVKLIPIFDEITSKLLYEYYLLKIIMCYVELTDDSTMIVRETYVANEETDLVTVEYLDDKEARVNFMETTQHTDAHIFSGNKKLLKQNIATLLGSYIDILCQHKDTIDISYDTIVDRVFKLKAKEKDTITDRLEFISDESREVDNVFKKFKLGTWGKGLQKGLTQYDKDTYDEERELRDKLAEVENKIRNINPNMDEQDMTDAVEEEIREQDMTHEIEAEEYDMRNMNDDYDDGNYVNNDEYDEDYN
jgi:hypothetical protein